MRLLASILLVFTLHLSAAPKDQAANGNLTYGQEVFNTLQVNGFVTLNGTTILQRLQVNGRLNATNVQMGALSSHGEATLSHCKVKDLCNVTGTLKAYDTTFEELVTLISNNSTFDACSIDSIDVLKTRETIPQTIELKGKTTVTGTITFDSENGQVIACKECQIAESNIVGGKLIRR